MSPNELRDFLHSLQENMYHWPDRYLAWEKPDGTFFMASTQTTQYGELLIYEIDPVREANYSRFTKEMGSERGIPDADERIYSARYYDINPQFVHMRGPNRVDPVEELVSKVSEYTFLGSWDNPEHFRKDHTNGQVLNHSCWFEALQNIRQHKRRPSLLETMEQADSRAKAQQVMFTIPEKEPVR